MKKLVAVLTSALLVTSIASAYLWVQLRAERARAKEKVVQLQAPQSMPPTRIAASGAPESAKAISTAIAGAPGVPGQVEPSSAQQHAAQSINAQLAVARQNQPAAAEPARQPGKRSANPLAAGVQEMMNTAEGKELMHTMMRTMLPQQYPDVGRELNMSPAETGKFFDLLASQTDDIGEDSMTVMNGTADPATMQDAQRRLAQKDQAQEAAVAALLGDKYPGWQEYKSTATVRQDVNELRTALSSSATPLTDTQSKQLITVLAAEQKRMEQDEHNWTASGAASNSPNMMQESLQRATDSRRRMVDVAAPYLTADQVDIYRRQVDQQMNMVNAMMGLAGMPGGAPAAPPAKAPAAGH